ncbi:High-affinity nicotinic acid transporter [Wickerhamomyces ciferrii]|uniref:High-affinity nicotinic acid transporter n=1 Tax=Wickerhamomyces ciferrii (strain ATCC 14091 / BCRC 22168 / CBS 111 / JCM 3599 / NBRC 0793 / NRRL Y-1031 F-60-10) TaxID=1206466 RepID=K0KNI7_WICCF|nr:High-affinity nicotinic acid transporter [Wickerhamomyces ciferrii]CCH46800.1 High-affinity nicotinic acid transporter [Wickerhamomyces ciferrii]
MTNNQAGLEINKSSTTSSQQFEDVDIEKTNLQQQTASHELKTESEKKLQTDQLAQELGINERKLTWKLDVCIVPPFVLLYFLAFLDRINISNAKVYGMAEDLNLKGNEFNVALTIFFVPYVFFEIISNHLMKKISPHIWLSGCILLFGIVTLAMGFVKNYSGLLACRFFLGVFESATFPGIFYILSTYYTGAESQKRFSSFFSCTCLAGAAGGAIAFKIHDLDGTHGYGSWQWIFIIEGTFTAGLAFLLFFIIPDFPENARFLNANEREFVKRKLEIHSVSSGLEIKYSFKDSLKSFKDPLYALTALAYFGLIIPSYGYAYFSPTIIKEMGYTAQNANQHSVYPWLAAFGYTNIIAVISDLTKLRSPFAISSALIAIVGLSLVLGLVDNANGRYAGCFLVATGLYSSMPSLVCWTALNFGGHMRKSLGTANQVGFGNIGGIVSTFIFLAVDAPRYVKGLSIGIAFTVFSILMMLIMIGIYQRRNSIKKSDGYRSEYFKQSDRDIVLGGDKHPAFKYLY